MKLIIDIDETDYKDIVEQVKCGDYPDMSTGRAIANGTVLPIQEINYCGTDINYYGTRTVELTQPDCEVPIGRLGYQSLYFFEDKREGKGGKE